MRKKLYLLLPLLLSVIALCVCFVAGCGENTAHTEHEWGEYTVITEPTCETQGKHIRTCTICGAEDPYTIMPALGHDWDEGKITKPATCTEDGEIVQTCKNDPSHTNPKKIPATGHDWAVKEVTKEATCIKGGEQIMYCKNNPEETETRKTSAKGHSWTEWTWTTGEANCNTGGHRKRECTVCHTPEEQDVAAVGHKWGDWSAWTDATCTEGGESSHTCSVCGTKESAHTTPLGHDWGDWHMDEEPTCTKGGKRSHTCQAAGCNKTETETVPALGHDYTFTVKSAATETAEGKEEGTCSVCKTTCERTIPALGKSAKKGIYRIVVGKTNGRRIITWHADENGALHRTHTETEGYAVYYTDENGENHIKYDNKGVKYINQKGKLIEEKDWSYPVYYTTEITITKTNGDFVFRGNLISQRNYVMVDSLGGWRRNEEMEPHLEIELPIDDYKVTLGDIPDGYIYETSYDLKKDSFVRIEPDKDGKGVQSTDSECSKTTKATDPINMDGQEIENGQSQTLSASLSIALTSKMSDTRLPSKNDVSVDGKKGGIFQGAILPDFYVTTVDNNIITLSSLLKEKKLVILDVYYYGCTWCQAAAPEFVRFANDHEDDIAVICLNRDDASVSTAKGIYDEKGPYKYPEWFYCALDVSRKFNKNIENTGKIGAPTQVVIDDGFCVADVLPSYEENGYDLLRRNLPGRFTKIADKASSGDEEEKVGSLPPVVLPERKELFA